MVDLEFERRLWSKGIGLVAGVDEAGRGPLAGPVVAAAVVFPADTWIEGVNDSKKLSAGERERVFELITQKAMSIGVGIVPNTIIDRVNIFQATMQAMAEAVAKLSSAPQHLLVDGPHYRDSTIPCTRIVDGDAKCFTIAAASIIAKVTRDRLMVEYDKAYPQYGFAKHKGYGTKEHREAIRKFGSCELHRQSFRLLARILSDANE